MIGSRADHIVTPTKFPRVVVSAASKGEIYEKSMWPLRLTCDIFWISFREDHYSNNTDDTDTVISVSGGPLRAREAALWTYNPAVRKMPVKMLFCRVEVRRRHSRGTGLMRGQRLTEEEAEGVIPSKQR